MDSGLTDGGMVDNGWKEGLVNAWRYTYICIWKEGCVHVRMMDGWMDEGRCKGEGMDGEMKGWVDEKMSEWTHG